MIATGVFQLKPLLHRLSPAPLALSQSLQAAALPPNARQGPEPEGWPAVTEPCKTHPLFLSSQKSTPMGLTFGLPIIPAQPVNTTQLALVISPKATGTGVGGGVGGPGGGSGPQPHPS
ncbi:MAG: hypothetical protein A2784_01875 [Candidatus Chisholmbacteria bacterium RIFCSPHIGHO2_01_FULL_48_12]|uniref:Uncharacterized protein n=1 Tax=Candidatus Chisholmbacteria bacterium RIFCSPHIGHO2_01_FULL_48_12 TaxID=1797589 RepID=A0A1G1VRS7_9BACT|nr:MAG: hypothetical protein A2784_01875 [Candidatus Chisholmbacteria bacterium RIFCSPHIGHO2_01_FULL_48_12]